MGFTTEIVIELFFDGFLQLFGNAGSLQDLGEDEIRGDFLFPGIDPGVVFCQGFPDMLIRFFGKIQPQLLFNVFKGGTVQGGPIQRDGIMDKGLADIKNHSFDPHSAYLPVMDEGIIQGNGAVIKKQEKVKQRRTVMPLSSVVRLFLDIIFSLYRCS